MPNPISQESNGSFFDRIASANRVVLVDATGAEYAAGAVSVQRTPTIQRVTTATTTTVAAGAQAISVRILAATSASTPTVGGVAVPTDGVVTFTAKSGDTLGSLSVVTLTGDDVLITSVV